MQQENIIGTELTMDELAQVQGGGWFDSLVNGVKWVASHLDDGKKIYKAAKSVWDTVKGWF